MGAFVREFEVVVVGGGHAGVEGAWACANAGVRCALVSLDPEKIGVMSCNPAIGGLGKGQMVREVDALGGLMGLATDATGIMFKMLNASKGAAVRGPRAQCDKHAYARTVRSMVASRAEIEIVAGAVERLVVEGGRIRGVVVRDRDGAEAEMRAGAVVLTTGTFMRGLMHSGAVRTEGGRIGEGAAVGISHGLRELGFELGRLKTGTPPRLRRESIDWDALEPDRGDADPAPFSDLTDLARFPAIAQVECRITRTTPEAHDLIRANLHRAPMYSGQIESAGPRYCPSIEDKVVRFADREHHHVFLEPESHESDWVYCNGISTSLPRDIQDAIVRAMPGCANAEVLQHGYAVEYDMVRPHQIDATAMTKRIVGLFLAGQINGTSGYEEAAGQGVLAGINAVRFARGHEPVALGRDEAYIGVMMDDLVTKTPVEPYRMFTSRAEHRLVLRSDNAADRLTPLGRAWGVVDDARWSVYERRASAVARVRDAMAGVRIGEKRVADLARRPETTALELAAMIGPAAEGVPPGVIATALAEAQYDGFILRARAEAKRQVEMERRTIPAGFEFDGVVGLRAEARSVLTRFRPTTFGQAGRLEGVNPADITILIVAVDRWRRERATAPL
jgi:tRNA uridine 5-carboxymethylaminomethyl modification enzyme